MRLAYLLVFQCAHLPQKLVVLLFKLRYHASLVEILSVSVNSRQMMR